MEPVALDGRLPADDLRLIEEGLVGIVTDAIAAFGGTFSATAEARLLGLFGVPRAHEDDAERAVRAALRVVEDAGAFGADVARGWEVAPLGVRVGVHTGPVLAGPESGATDDRVAAVGGTITTVARLASLAPTGTVLVEASTRRLVDPLFAWGDAHVLEDGGRLVAFEAAAARPVSGKFRRLAQGRTELVGREHEVAAAARAVDSALAGAGGVLFVSGEAGIGKSRLVAELRHRFEAGPSAHGPPLWLEGRCVSFGQSLPYGPFRELLREWLGTSPQQPELRTRIALRREVSSLFGADGDRLHPLLASVLGLPLERDAAEALAGRAPDLLQTAIFEAVADLVERLATDRPVVVAVDDVQWADPTSVQLVEHLLATTETAAVLVVLSGRAEPDHASWELRETAVRRLGHRARELTLGPLDGGADARMLRSLLGVATLPRNIGGVLQVAEGNPFFLEELIGSLVESGTLTRAAEGWHLQDAAVEVPHTVEGLLQSRIDRLSHGSREVLTAASVLGRQFALELVEHLCDPDTDVPGALRELERADLVREARRWPRREYRFKHVLIQEAAYRTLVGDWRQELHRRAAHGLETLVPDRVAESYALLAHHCRRAGEVPRAAAYHRLAGDGARRVHAVDEALEHYSAGVALASEEHTGVAAATVAGLHLGRGLMWMQRGDAGARDDLERALLASREAGDRALELEALEGLGLVESFRHGRRDEALRHFEQGLRMARAAGDDATTVAFANRLTIEYVHRLELDRAFEWGQQALAAGARAGTDAARARAIDGLKLVAVALGDLPTLRDLTGQLRRLLTARDDLWYLKFTLSEASLEAAGRGRFAEATGLLDEACSINDRLGHRVDSPNFLTVRAW
ncbi:MAG: AAA family ATPase, partial [Actinobacteria bacterium]|nr:AAA family ATPase [Actinomycetota bacterium]